MALSIIRVIRIIRPSLRVDGTIRINRCLELFAGKKSLPEIKNTLSFQSRAISLHSRVFGKNFQVLPLLLLIFKLKPCR